MKNKSNFQRIMLICVIIAAAIFIIYEAYWTKRTDVLGYSHTGLFLYNIAQKLTEVIIPALIVLLAYLGKKEACLIALATRCIIGVVKVVATNISNEYFSWRSTIYVALVLIYIVIVFLFAYDKLTFKKTIVAGIVLQGIIFVVYNYIDGVINSLGQILNADSFLTETTAILNIAYAIAILLMYICTIGVFGEKRTKEKQV